MIKRKEKKRDPIGERVGYWAICYYAIGSLSLCYSAFSFWKYLAGQTWAELLFALRCRGLHRNVASEQPTLLNVVGSNERNVHLHLYSANVRGKEAYFLIAAWPIGAQITNQFWWDSISSSWYLCPCPWKHEPDFGAIFQTILSIGCVPEEVFLVQQPLSFSIGRIRSYISSQGR